MAVRLVGVQRQSSCYIVSGTVEAADGATHGSGAAQGGGAEAGGGRGGGGNGGGMGDRERDGARVDDVILLTKRPVGDGDLSAGGAALGSMRLLGLVLHSDGDAPGGGTRCAATLRRLGAARLTLASALPSHLGPPRSVISACLTQEGTRLPAGPGARPLSPHPRSTLQVQVSLRAAPSETVRAHLESLLVHNMRLHATRVASLTPNMREFRVRRFGGVERGRRGKYEEGEWGEGGSSD